MNGVERRMIILSRLQQNEKVLVSSLAEEFNVVPMTIRRDLKALEATGRVKIQHGGAVLNKDTFFMHGMQFRKKDYIEEKRQIAKACLSYIYEGECIFLDSGTTVSEIASLLFTYKHLTVVTNSLLVADALADNQELEIIMCPGNYVMSSMAYMGPFTNDFIGNFHFDKAFLSTSMIDYDKGLTVSWHMEGGLKKKILQQSEVTICAADSSKFDQSSYFGVCSLEEIDFLVTDAKLTEVQKEHYQTKVRIKQA